jgi:acyl carrier protein
MQKTSLNNKILDIIKNELKMKKISIKDGINITKKWDSISNLNILLQIENKLKIKFNTREFNSLNNTKVILSNVRKKIKK